MAWSRHERAWWLLALFAGIWVAPGACAESPSSATSAGPGGGGEDGSDDTISVSVGGGAGGSACDPGLASDDVDGDGFSEEQGDCNDCDPNANPQAMEVIAGDGVAGRLPPAVTE